MLDAFVPQVYARPGREAGEEGPPPLGTHVPEADDGDKTSTRTERKSATNQATPTTGTAIPYTYHATRVAESWLVCGVTERKHERGYRAKA